MKGFPVRGDRVTDGDRMLHKVPRTTVEEPMREHVPGDAERVVQACKDKPCTTTEPELFHPLTETAPADLRQIQVAKTYCRRCPVQHACAEWATSMGASGVWGATTERERRERRRRWVG